MKLLKINSRGEDVKKLQTRLKELGYFIQVDGIFGRGTESAVKSEQQMARISPDGIVGEKTWNVLFPKVTQYSAPAAQKKNAPTGIIEGDYKITSPFGMRKHPITGVMQNHNGIDLAGVPKGTPVYSPVAGTVKLAAFSRSAGNWIQIQNNALTFIFMHLDKYSVTTGQRVSAWQQIGTVGTTGASTGVHLHFELRENNNPINPEKFIKK